MKAWQLPDWCEPEEMTFADVDSPTPKQGEERIKNHRQAGLNRPSQLRLIDAPPFHFFTSLKAYRHSEIWNR